MRSFFFGVMLACFVTSPSLAQATTCRTDAQGCQGYTSFGPAAVDRCISVRGQNPAAFCQAKGDVQRVYVQSGDSYCAVEGAGPVPDDCTPHWITVTEPQQ